MAADVDNRDAAPLTSPVPARAPALTRQHRSAVGAGHGHVFDDAGRAGQLAALAGGDAGRQQYGHGQEQDGSHRRHVCNRADRPPDKAEGVCGQAPQ